MLSSLKPFAIATLAVIVGLMVYNMFISGSSWFGHFESSNFEVDDEGRIYENGVLKVA